MSNWQFKRNGEVIGCFLAARVVKIGDTVYAKTDGRVVGVIASGPDQGAARDFVE